MIKLCFLLHLLGQPFLAVGKLSSTWWFRNPVPFCLWIYRALHPCHPLHELVCRGDSHFSEPWLEQIPASFWHSIGGNWSTWPHLPAGEAGKQASSVLRREDEMAPTPFLRILQQIPAALRLEHFHQAEQNHSFLWKTSRAMEPLSILIPIAISCSLGSVFRCH